MAQEVEVKIKVETSQAVNDVNKLGDAFDNTKTDAEEAQKAFSKAGNGVQVEQSIAGLKQLKRELKNVAVGSDEFKKLYNDIDDLEDKLKSAKNTSSDWIDSLEQAGGPIGMLGSSLNRAKVATQSFGGALKATGIGLVVSLIGGLVAAFQDNEVAMKKLQPLLDGIGKVFNGVFRAVEPLFNTLVDLAVSALPMVSKAFAAVYSANVAVFQSFGMIGGAIKKLISGDFSGAWKDAKSSVNDFGKNYDDSIKRFIAGTQEVTKVEKKEGKTRVTNKKETNAELDKLNQERLDKDMQSAKDAMAILDEIAKAKETPAQKELREYNEKKAVLEANNLDTAELTNAFLISQADAEYAIYEENKAKKKEQSDKDLADEKALQEQKIAAELAYQQAKRNALDTGLNILQQFAGKNKGIALAILAVQKGLAIADVVVGASKSISAATSALAAVPAVIGVVPNPMYAVQAAATLKGIATTKITAATSIASILASGISSASSITAGSGGASGGGGGGGAISTPQSAQPINVVGASQTNAIAQTIAQQGQQPIKAYVVANDVTTQQSLDRNIVSSASIG